MNNVELSMGDCREILSLYHENSIDTCITDPPYGLKFMGKEWDHGVPGVEFWEAVLRVLKPGAMLLAFGGTRTYHRLACAIEDAGFQLRDCLMWIYGSGFPKSMDLGKAIDKTAGIWRGKAGKVISDNSSMSAPNYERTDKGDPVTDLAKQWNGWGTALKPAWEPILLAMKPLDGTYAQNLERWGVAGLNVDGCRIGTDSTLRSAGVSPTDRKSFGKYRADAGKGREIFGSEKGRFPANLILDEDSGRMLDEQSGTLKSGSRKEGTHGRGGGSGRYGDHGVGEMPAVEGNSGGASRFFYCSKASKKDRGEGNNHPTVKPTALMEYLVHLTATPTGGVVLDPFMGSGSTGVACAAVGRPFVGIELDEESYRVAEKRIG